MQDFGASLLFFGGGCAIMASFASSRHGTFPWGMFFSKQAALSPHIFGVFRPQKSSESCRSTASFQAFGYIVKKSTKKTADGLTLR